jgi:hypothetical protein
MPPHVLGRIGKISVAAFIGRETVSPAFLLLTDSVNSTGCDLFVPLDTSVGPM